MANSGDLINFDVIESQKENIQSLPGGRSAKKLAELYSPQSSVLHGKLMPTLTPTPNPGDTKTLHDTIRADFEAEVDNLAESDDPLDVYDRYVRWTLDAYPSTQATPQSQLHLLLERATKAFVGNVQYRNDPRYLRIWLHYIHFFSDAPREAYVYLARHNIGEALALFYEEYAAWLEGAGRWAQADEVFQMGMERGARPQSRLIRKYSEFEQRRTVQAPESLDQAEPASPALPTVRPALAAKVDPFASAVAAAQDPQEAQQLHQQRQQQRAGNQAARSTKPKMAIFSDASAPAQAPAMSSHGNSIKGWESIGSLAERKKENVMVAKPWAGEKLKAGGKKSTTKMAVFKDASLAKSHITIHPSQYQVTVNPQSRKKERVFVDLRVVYPTPEEPGTELSFEEVWAANRGLLHKTWDAPEYRQQENKPLSEEPPVVDLLTDAVETKLVVHRDTVMLDENGAMIKPHGNAGKSKKKKAIEMNETQIIKAKLDSPTSRKLKKRGSISEPTMTIHTRAATDDIYEIFNQPLPKPLGIDDDDASEVSDDDYETDGDYTSGAESTNITQRISTSEAGDEDEADEDDVADGIDGDEISDEKGSAEWVDMAIHGHIAGLDEQLQNGSQADDQIHEYVGENAYASVDAEPVDEVEEAAIAETTDLAPISTPVSQVDNADSADETNETGEEKSLSPPSVNGLERQIDRDAAPSLPSSPIAAPANDELEPPRTRTIFIPIPPEDYVAPTRPYRDPVEVANNRLPFMTPITERTESSLEFDSEDNKRALHAKTPSKAVSRYTSLSSLEDDGDEVEEDEDEEASSALASASVSSSPLLDVVDEDDDIPEFSPVKLPASMFRVPLEATESPKVQSAEELAEDPVATPSAAPAAEEAVVALAFRPAPIKGPIIKDTQCNPIDESLRTEILAKMHPPLSSYAGFYDHSDKKCDKGAEIRRYAKAVAKAKANGNGSDRSSSTGLPVEIKFPGCPSEYAVRRELGAGAFAPVYLVENLHAAEEQVSEENDENAVTQMGRGSFASAHTARHTLEALKMETPPTAWEFHMMRLSHTRLGPQHRATASLAPGLECHLYRDETFLFLPFYPHGTLLDVVNLFRGEASGVMDETLAMFFTIELLRTAEALHSKSILHGDIKADNCLLRLEDPLSRRPRHVDGNEQLSSQWKRDGSGGWAARGITLIDFGRGIDMKAFTPDVRFVADWKTTAQDCAEMREGRPWTWQIDYHGLAGAVHVLLFGKYMETVRCDQGSAGLGAAGVRRYRLREALKRYWQADIWNETFDLLLNPGGCVENEEGGKLPALRTMRNVREKMEAWLEANCERGVGLKGLMMRIEAWSRGRK